MFKFIDDLLDRRFFEYVESTQREPLRQLFKSEDGVPAQFMKQSAPPGSASRYARVFCAGRGYGRRSPYPSIWWEAPYGFTLDYDLEGSRKPIACIGFALYRQKPFVRRMHVVQIQGMRGMKEYLRPIRWERYLLHTALAYAPLLGVTQVAVTPAAESLFNPLYQPVVACHNRFTFEESVRQHERMQIAYDQNAKRHKFTYSEAEKLWIRDI